ncbi:GntR family transcriptional regulator [Georgenia alba]|uniref:GntR family transcriptional regulator n=1 Tax=Georgenia alba TaxID=2233858 RepID=A0ABW2Q6F1_9MICO
MPRSEPSGRPDAADAADLADLTVLGPTRGGTVSRAEAAYYRIRDLVVTLELPPGAPLHEPELMARLDLGRTPVREALRRLADDGLVTIWPRRGMAVATVDARDLAGIAEVRVELEPLAARLAAGRAGEPQRRQAEELAGEVAQVGEDPLPLIRLDQRVHRFLYDTAANRFLAATLEEYLVLSVRLWFLGLDRVGRLEEAVGEHREVLTAVAAGDAERAADAVREHVRAFHAAIARVLSGW